MERGLWLHLLCIKMNLSVYHKAIHFAILATELPNGVVNLQACLQRLCNLLRLFNALLWCANLKACFLEGNSLLRSEHVLWYLYLCIADKLLGTLCDLGIIKHPYRLAPAREDNLSCSASLLKDLSAHATALPVHFTHGILGTLSLIATS